VLLVKQHAFLAKLGKSNRNEFFLIVLGNHWR